MFYFYHPGSFQLKTLGYGTHKINTLHYIQSLLVCKFRSPFTPNWKKMSIPRNTGVPSHSHWCTGCICVSRLEGRLAGP